MRDYETKMQSIEKHDLTTSIPDKFLESLVERLAAENTLDSECGHKMETDPEKQGKHYIAERKSISKKNYVVIQERKMHDVLSDCVEQNNSSNVVWSPDSRLPLAMGVPEELLSVNEHQAFNHHVRLSSEVVGVNKSAYGTLWYVKPKNWSTDHNSINEDMSDEESIDDMFKQTREGLKKLVSLKKFEEKTRKDYLRMELPELFISQQYKQYIVSTNAGTIPDYLQDTT